MGDEDDGLSLCLEPADNLHQLIDFLWREDGGGLVKDDDVGIAVEGFENLHPLLHAHGDVLYHVLGIHHEAVLFRQLPNPFLGGSQIQHPVLGGLNAQNNVLRHGVVVDKLEVLVHHADSQGGSRIGILDPHLLSPNLDDAGVRIIGTKEDGHEG